MYPPERAAGSQPSEENSSGGGRSMTGAGGHGRSYTSGSLPAGRGVLKLMAPSDPTGWVTSGVLSASRPPAEFRRLLCVGFRGPGPENGDLKT